jgi:GAF domain-containing protein
LREVTDGMTTKASAVLFPALAATLQRKSITMSVITGILFAVSTALIGLGGPLEDAADTRQVVAGIVAFAIGTLLGIAREWAQWWVDRGQELAAAQFRIAVKDALRPVAELIAGMPSLTPRERKGRLKEVAKQVTGSMEVLLTDVEGLRTVVYELRDNGNRLEQIGYSGRGEAPEAFQRRPPGEHDEVFEALEQNRSRLVHDIRIGNREGRRNYEIDHGYLTFIAVPIVVGHDGFGMLTLDAPEPNSFTDTDLKLCEFVAELLGIAFACAKST